MSVMNRKLFNREARDELRRKGGIMASSEPMMQASGYETGGAIDAFIQGGKFLQDNPFILDYLAKTAAGTGIAGLASVPAFFLKERLNKKKKIRDYMKGKAEGGVVGYQNGGPVTREDILRFLAQGPVSRNPSGAAMTLDSLLYPARYSGQRQSGYTYNRPPDIDSPMTVTTVGPRGVMSQADPRKYYRGLVRDGVQEGDKLSNLLNTPDPGEVGSLTGRFKRPLSEIVDATAYSPLFGDRGSVARDLALRAAKFFESDTSVPREQIYGANPQVTGSDTAFETISQVSEPPSYLYVNIPGVTPSPVLMTERDFERFEKMYPDAAQSSDSTVIDVASLDSRVDISNLPIVTSLDSTSGSRKDAVEKTKKTTTSSTLPIRGSDTNASKELAELLADRRSDLSGVNLPGPSETYEIDPNAALAAGQAIIESENTDSSTESELADNESKSETVTERQLRLGKKYGYKIPPPLKEFLDNFKTEEIAPQADKRRDDDPDLSELVTSTPEAPEKPKFPSLDQFIEVQGGRDKRETIQKNADETLDDATKDFKEVKTGDAFDDTYDKYVSKFSEIFGDDEEEKKRNTGFALAMYGATYAATGDAGQAAMNMIETLRGDAATRQERKDKIKMLALNLASEQELSKAKRETDFDDAIKLYDAKMKIKELYDDPKGFLDSADGRAALQIYLSAMNDENLNEEDRLAAALSRGGELVQRLLQEFPALGSGSLPKQGSAEANTFVDNP